MITIINIYPIDVLYGPGDLYFCANFENMNVLILLIMASIFIAGIFLLAFLWSSQDGQFEDTYSPARRILYDDQNSENKPND